MHSNQIRDTRAQNIKKLYTNQVQHRYIEFHGNTCKTLRTLKLPPQEKIQLKTLYSDNVQRLKVHRLHVGISLGEQLRSQYGSASHSHTKISFKTRCAQI